MILLWGDIAGNPQHKKSKIYEIELVEEVEVQPVENALLNDVIIGIKGLVFIVLNVLGIISLI